MEGGKCVATPTGGEDAVTNVRSAWQELTNMITAGVATDEDSKIIIPAGTTIRIGTEELEFHDTCIINPSAEADNTAVVDTVRACAKLNTGVDITGKDNIEFQLKEGSELQVSSSFARLNRDVEITSNAVLTATDYLTQLKDSGSITHMVLVGATMFMDALGNASGQTVQVNIKDVTPAPAQYTVTAKDGDVVRTYGPFNAGETLSGLVDPAEQEGKIFVGWFDQDGNEVKDGTVVTKDLELTAQFKNAPYTITFSAPGPNGATLTFQRKADESGLIDKFPEDAKLDGYTFNGWFVGDDQVTAETVFTADTTVTAKFTQNPVNPPVGPTTPVTPVTPVTPPTNPENPGDVEIDDPDTPLDQLPVEEQIAAVQAAKIKTTSKMTTLNGKKAIKVSWKVPADIEALGLDGYQVFKSTKRYSGFGKKPIFETTKKTYTNNKDLVKGNTYYYKVRGYKVIEGKKYYTTWSTKAWRIL
ncbi:MAG: InlB B-repeat-containing protein [Firmicutes bacterium]|nr:InlB B-repeat-containing protein [Bacillota bacterium]